MLQGLQGVTFHSLRHSQGALLFEQGEHPLVVARRLGHTSVRTVLDIYGHLFEGIDQDAADRLDESVRNAGAGPGADQTPPEGDRPQRLSAEKPLRDGVFGLWALLDLNQ